MSSLISLIKQTFEGLTRYNPFFRFLSYSWIARPIPIKPFLHQVEVFDKIMLRKPIRVLLGDEIGLGKTITAIVVAKYLWDVGEASRILILVPRILVKQWAKELRWWGIEVKHIERETMDSLIEHRFPEGWYLASMDLIKRPHYFRHIKQVPWDMLIVDEAHRLSPTAEDRWKTIGRLIENNPQMNVMLLSATPHKGFPDDYIARLKLLDPSLKAPKRELNQSGFYRATWNAIVFRRTRNDVRKFYEGAEIFPPATIKTLILKPSKREKTFHHDIRIFAKSVLDRYKDLANEQLRGLYLLLAIIVKRALSSPVSALSTLSFIIAKRAEIVKGLSTRDAEAIAERLRKALEMHVESEYEEPELDEATAQFLREKGISSLNLDAIVNHYAAITSVLLRDEDIERLKEIVELAQEIIEEGDTKLKALIELIRTKLNEGCKIIVFTEYETTANYIKKALKAALGDIVCILTGGWRESSWREIEDGFIRGDRYKVLVATDVASEGLNLQVANVVIIYDLPWSPIKLEQRVGRVWRIGQRRPVEVYILALGSDDEKRIFTILYQKILNMSKALRGKIPPLLGEMVEVCYEGQLSGLIMMDYTPPVEERREGIRRSMNEEDLILNWARGDRDFAEFVRWYLKMLAEFQSSVRSLSVFPESEKGIKSQIALTDGISSVDELRWLLIELVRVLAKHKDALKTISGKEFIRREDGRLSQIDIAKMSAEELIEHARRFLVSCPQGIVPNMVVYSDNIGFSDLRIVKVGFLMKESANKRIEYIIGVDMVSKRILNSIELLKLLLKLTEETVIEEDGLSVKQPDIMYIESLLFEEFRRTLPAKGLNAVREYLEVTSKMGFRLESPGWTSDLAHDVKILIEPIARIVVRRSKALEEHLKIDIGEYTKEKLKVESESIELIKQIEANRFNVIEVNDINPVFDLILVNEKEQRMVEVKGFTRRNLIIYPEQEYEFAQRAENGGANYWLYVADLRHGQRRLFRFRTPFNRKKVRLIHVVKYRDRRYYILTVVGESDE